MEIPVLLFKMLSGQNIVNAAVAVQAFNKRCVTGIGSDAVVTRFEGYL